MNSREMKGYKEQKAYKGFESWWHGIQMTAKMHATIVVMILALQVILSLGMMYIFQRETLSLVFSSFGTFSPRLWLLSLKVLMKSINLYLVLTIPAWLLYPILLVKFKLRAREIMKDETLRGARLVSEEELRKIALEEVRKEWKEERKSSQQS